MTHLRYFKNSPSRFCIIIVHHPGFEPIQVSLTISFPSNLKTFPTSPSPSPTCAKMLTPQLKRTEETAQLLSPRISTLSNDPGDVTAPGRSILPLPFPFAIPQLLNRQRCRFEVALPIQRTHRQTAAWGAVYNNESQEMSANSWRSLDALQILTL